MEWKAVERSELTVLEKQEYGTHKVAGSPGYFGGKPNCTDLTLVLGLFF